MTQALEWRARTEPSLAPTEQAFLDAGQALADTEQRTLTRLTFDADIDMSPVWTPDGLRVVYASARAGVLTMYLGT